MMKAALFIAFILFISPVSAQDYFVKAGVGAGISGVSPTVYPGNMPDYCKVSSSDYVQLTIGRNYGNIQVETGMSYLRTGTSYDISPQVLFYAGPIYIPEIKFVINNGHLMIPAILSYVIRKDRKISFYPGAGFEAVYNFKGEITRKNQFPSDYNPQVSTYNAISAMVLLKFDAQYKISKEWSIWGGIMYHQMFTSLISEYHLYDFASVFNAGVKYNLHTSKRKTEKS